MSEDEKQIGMLEQDRAEMEHLIATLVAENARLAEVERKAIAQSEYIQSHGLTEYEMGRLKTERDAAQRDAAELAGALQKITGLIGWKLHDESFAREAQEIYTTSLCPALAKHAKLEGK